MKIAICDDSNEFISMIIEYLNKLGETDIDTFNSGEELVEHYKKAESLYDVLFLDMEMKILDGITTGKLIRDIDKSLIIIFMTSHTKYMQESFECLPFRYLTKPVQSETFSTTIRDIHKRLNENRRIYTFKLDGEIIRLKLSDILYFESSNHYINIFTSCRTYKFKKSMSKLENELKHTSFVRPHNSFIINIEHIRTMNDTDITLNNCLEKIPISRRRKSAAFSETFRFREREKLG